MDKILQYLAALEAHNDRTWFHENKALYQEAQQEFETLVAELIQAVRQTDGQIPLAAPKELTFKLMRDTRFSHDKSPYNPSFRAHIGPQGKLPIPVGYYLMIRPGGRSFLGGGLFADMFRDATAMIRDAIAAQGGQWQQIVTDPVFTEYFTVQGSKLKNVPRGYDAGHPQAEALKHKSWYVEFPLSDEQLTAPGFVPFAAGVFAAMQPFNAFLNRALQDFTMPAR